MAGPEASRFPPDPKTVTGQTSATGPADGAATGLAGGRFTGREAFQQTVRAVLSEAAAQAWPDIILSDPDFEDWPLGEAAVVQSLNDWSKSGRRLILLAHTFSAIQNRHFRFVRWRQTWDHITDCRRCKAGESTALPSAIWSPAWLMHRLEGDRIQGVLSNEPSRRFQLRETLAECMRRSSPGFPASTLGL
jgi:hypothetical protein